MRFLKRISSAPAYGMSFALAVVGLVAAMPATADAQAWAGYGRGAQHTALTPTASQRPQIIRWSTPVDLAPQYASGGALYTHYGSPAITLENTVIVPVKTGAAGGFEVIAIKAASGNVMWTMTTDYELPGYNWVPPMGVVLTSGDLSLAVPGAGGTVLLRTSPDIRAGITTRVAFFGMTNYRKDPAAFNSAIQICTPISADAGGNLYFGFVSNGQALPGYPNGIPSGLARVNRLGGSFVSAAALSLNQGSSQIAMNCAPAISADGNSVYVATTGGDGAYLCLASANPALTPRAAVFLVDPSTSGPASVFDESTASPTIGPDGDVYFGVLEQNVPSGHNDRGWLLHFDSALKTSKIPGSFGWDDSASVVPAKAVPSYTGTSPYLLLTKYNNYANADGNGENKVAVLDPFASEADPIRPQVNVMKEVITVLGPTANTGLPGVREWCINSAAVDETNKCAIINSEDGHVYRWSFVTNTLTDSLSLANPTGEAYTPTAIGPDGAVYAINDAKLYCCVASGGGPTTGSLPIAPPSLPTIDMPPRITPTLTIAAFAVAFVAALGMLWAAARILGGRRLQPVRIGAVDKPLS